MNRRSLLRSLGVAGAVAVAGCSGGGGGEPSGEEPEPPNPTGDGNGTGGQTATPPPDPVPNIDATGPPSFEEADDGGLLVSISVENVADKPESAVLVVTVRAGDKEETRERTVSLGPNASKTYTFDLEMTYDSFTENGAIDVEMKPAEES